MSIYDQFFNTTKTTAGKWPYIYFADQQVGSLGGYVNNSLEGLLFNQNPLTTGTIIIPSGLVTPDWAFYTANLGSANKKAISAIAISSGVCTITCAAISVSVGDVVSVNGVGWDATHPYVNGCWAVASLSGGGTVLTFEINAPDTASYASMLGGSPFVSFSPVFSIYDNRPPTDAKGQSFTSVLFAPQPIATVNTGYKRVLPADLYTRFKFQSSSDITPQGGINSNLFSALSPAGLNIKPVLWAYFFGYSSTVTPSSLFEVAFNSYAFVLRPSGDGSKLEFALVKFAWGVGPWTAGVGTIAASDKFASYTVSGTDLGYLISTNPAVGQEGVPLSPVVTELATSDSFTYNSEVTPKFNLKVTIRKHLLSDSILDGTYLVNLMINDDYNNFGESAHYDSILHAYIEKPSPVYVTTTSDGIGSVHDSMLMPIMYFKYNNTNEDNVQVDLPFASPPVTGASKIVQDSLFFRQINSVAGASYLY